MNEREHILTKNCWCKPRVVKVPTKKQQKILDFIAKFQKLHKHSPTLKNIAEKFGVSQPTVHQQVAALAQKGYLKRKKNERRSFTLV